MKSEFKFVPEEKDFLEREEDLDRQLFYNHLGRLIWEKLERDGFSFHHASDRQATEILTAISEVIRDTTLTDFDKVDEIVEIFTRYNLDTGEDEIILDESWLDREAGEIDIRFAGVSDQTVYVWKNINHIFSNWLKYDMSTGEMHDMGSPTLLIYGENIYTRINVNAITNDHIPDSIDSCPSDGPTSWLAITLGGAATLPDVRILAKSSASATVKLPVICDVPPLISPCTVGDEITVPSRTIAIQRPIFSRVRLAQIPAPSLFIVMLTLGRPPF